MLFSAKQFSGRDADTEYKPYSPVSIHYMPHISTLQVVYDVIFLSLCLLLCACALGWRLWLAVFPVLPVPVTAYSLRKLLEHPVSSTAPPFYLFGAAMQGHLVRTAMIRTSHCSCAPSAPLPL
ncbi:MAG: hypothetical protein IPJ51_02025 [Saprospiraceae bacterium]|nr:hypothetical protein [Saprospiraceae bacterium]